MATGQSSRKNSKPSCILDLPYQALDDLSRFLDVDNRWKKLGSKCMGLDFETISYMELALKRDKSPTQELLKTLGDKNVNVNKFFMMLAKMSYQRAMLILKPYVDEKYHKYIHQGDSDTYSFSDISMASYMNSKSSFTSKKSYHSSSKSSYGESKSCSKYQDVDKKHREKGDSKYENDMNFNQNITGHTLKSKMNVLDVSKEPSKHFAPQDQKSPNLRSSRNEACENCKPVSITDNCVQEKIKNVRKSSLPQDILLNGKHGLLPSQLACASNVSTFDDIIRDVRQISYKEIIKATDDFNKQRILGRGGFGTVFKGEWNGTLVAIKCLTPKEGHNTESQQLVSLKQSVNEISILQRCRFDHILPFYGVSLDGAFPCLVYELMVNGSLEDWLFAKKKNNLPLTWTQRSNIAECVSKGLHYLHTTPKKPIVHGDIKSANILLDNNMGAKIGDFGLTREGPDHDQTHIEVTTRHGTECYLPLEYVKFRQLSPQVDIYCYGIVLLEMATGLRPFDHKKNQRLVEFVGECSTAGRLDSLRDIKAGEENTFWFRELLEIGQKCSSEKKKNRPPMLKVMEKFDKIKVEMSVVDKIRRLSNDKTTVSNAAKITADSKIKDFSPFRLQKVYDRLNDGQATPSQANNHSEATPLQNGHVTAGPANNLEKTENVIEPTNPLEIRVQGANSETQGNSEDQPHVQTQNSSILCGPHANINPTIPEEKSSELCTPNMPLLTLLQIPISKFNDTTSSFDDGYVVSDTNSDFDTDN